MAGFSGSLRLKSLFCLVIFLFHFSGITSLSSVLRGIQARVRIENVNIVKKRKRRKRQTVEEETKIAEILKVEFCSNKIQNLIVGSTCSIHSIHYKDANPLSGIFVDFVVVVQTLPTSVPQIVAELHTINEALGTDHGGSGLNFVGVAIESKYL